MQQAKMHGVRSHVSGTPILAEYDQLETKCINKYMAYSAQEIRSMATLYPFPDEASLTVEEGGRLTCSFDNEEEFCSWHSVQGSLMRFWKAHYNSYFDMDRMDCTNSRSFQFDEYFLLAGGEPTVGQHTVAIESKIECQLDNATMKFDFWTNSNGPILRQCIIKQNGDLECQDILPMPNPVNFSIPHSGDPFRVRIEVINVKSQDIVLIDNLYYEGRICELVDDNESTYSVIPTNQRSSPTFKASGLEEFLTEEKSSTATVLSKNHLGVLKVVSIDGSTDEDDTIEVLTTPQQTSELSVCEALSCDFNSQHPCFYGVSGIGSTAPWLIGSKLIGNRHTGIQKINPEDGKEVGFAYVGMEHISQIEEIFVMESPKFHLNRNVYLIFDLYTRSQGPQLQVCIDSFDYCPYLSPLVSKRIFWNVREKVFLQPGVRKVYFVAKGMAANLYLAIDHITVETEEGNDVCNDDLFK